MTHSTNQEIMDELKQLALSKSRPFCYPCYQPAPSGRCDYCNTDDLAREFIGHGVEWSVDWIIPIMVRKAAAPVQIEDAFEESVRECYAETVRIGWIEYDTTRAIQELDPVSWALACSEWLDEQVSEGRLITFDHGSTYYDTFELEQFLDQALSNAEGGDEPKRMT